MPAHHTVRVNLGLLYWQRGIIRRAEVETTYGEKNKPAPAARRNVGFF